MGDLQPLSEVPASSLLLTPEEAAQVLRVGRTTIYAPKAERSRRTLALPIQLVDARRAHRAAQLEERITAGSLWEDHDLVFAQANGRPIERKSDWQA